jgi:hypothetical protein
VPDQKGLFPNRHSDLVHHEAVPAHKASGVLVLMRT